MAGTRFIPFEPEQSFLLPPDLRSWLPEGHLAFFVLDVVKQFHLRPFYKDYDGAEGGRPPYDRQMMVGLILYEYSTGVFSSRKIEAATYESVAFRVVSADNHPDHDTIASFRRRHLKRLGKLFKKVLRLCREAGLVKLGTVALDGTKVQANASRHTAMSWERIGKSEGELEQEVKELLAKAERVDTEEGRRRDGEGTPAEMKRRESRLERLREAKAALEQRARERGDKDRKGGVGKAGDEKAQVIVAAEVTQETNDKRQVGPMVEAIKEEAGAFPRNLLADNGYLSDEQLGGDSVAAYVATKGERAQYKDRCRPVRRRAVGVQTREQRMAAKLSTKSCRAIYAKRKGIVEPVIGQIKHCRGFRQFLLRSLLHVTEEWKLICTTHNLLKLWRYARRPPRPSGRRAWVKAAG
jgi:transposase